VARRWGITVPDKDSYPGAGEFVPGGGASLAQLARAIQDCHGCDLYEHATQAVFGRGSARAEVVLIGEQPGDAEDRAGEPFVGPAGKREVTVVPTIHPSAVLRADDRDTAYAGLVTDLRAAASALENERG
jgi:uracil-DNA glycosylase